MSACALCPNLLHLSFHTITSPCILLSFFIHLPHLLAASLLPSLISPFPTTFIHSSYISTPILHPPPSTVFIHCKSLTEG